MNLISQMPSKSLWKASPHCATRTALAENWQCPALLSNKPVHFTPSPELTWALALSTCTWDVPWLQWFTAFHWSGRSHTSQSWTGGAFQPSSTSCPPPDRIRLLIICQTWSKRFMALKWKIYPGQKVQKQEENSVMQRLTEQPDTSLQLQAERQNSWEGTYVLLRAYQSNKCIKTLSPSLNRSTSPDNRGVFPQPSRPHRQCDSPWTDLVGAGGLVDPAGILVVALSLGLVGDPVGFIDGGDIVAQGDGLDSLVYTAAHGAPNLGGHRQPLHGWGLLGLLGDKDRTMLSECGGKTVWKLSLSRRLCRLVSPETTGSSHAFTQAAPGITPVQLGSFTIVPKILAFIVFKSYTALVY